MSAIGLSGNNASHFRATGSHADFRPEHFRFARTQSRGLSEAKWESRIKPLRTWSEILLYAAGGIVLIIAAFGLVV